MYITLISVIFDIKLICISIWTSLQLKTLVNKVR